MPRCPLARRLVPMVIVLVIGVAVSVAGLIIGQRYERQALRVDLERRTQNLVSYLRADLVQEFSLVSAQYLDVLAKGFGELESPTETDLIELTKERVEDSNDFIQLSFYWLPLVTSDDKSQFEQWASAVTGRPFRIRPLPAERSSGESGDYFPVLFYASAKNAPYDHGVDLASSPVIKTALDWSYDSGLTSVLGRVPLNESDLTPAEFFQCLPVYEGGGAARNAFGIRKKLKGYVAVVTTLIPNSSQSTVPSAGGIDICIYQRMNPTLAKFFGEAAPTDVNVASIAQQIPAMKQGNWTSGAYEASGRRWSYLALARDELIERSTTWRPYLIMGSGLLVTVLLALFVLNSALREMRVERLVHQRTAELETANKELEREVTERKRAEDMNRRLAAFPSQNPSPVFECDLEGGVLYANVAAEKVIQQLGLSSAEDLFPENHRDIITACINGGEMIEDIETMIHDRTFTWIYHHVPASGTVHLYASDVTERKRSAEDKARLEAQLRHSQKMEGIGTLAGGIAHDFNNLLAGVLGYSNMLKLQSDPGSNVFKAADVIEKAAERASQLTKQLLGFARKGKLQNVGVDVHGTVQEVVSLLSRTIDKNITIVQKLNAHGGSVLGDPGQMQQVFLNLAINSRDAMPEGGELRFETEFVTLDAHDCARYAEMNPGKYVLITVSDTGMGIPKEIQERVFEPFFTTKEQGKGTGMGLATVYGIVKNHGGTVRLYSEEGHGTTFKIFLPLSPDPAAASGGSESEEPVAGSGRILVIDDEAVVREMASDMLKILGYEVIVAADGWEAVEYYKEHGKDIDLAVIDMVMPKMGGRDCFRALKEINPGIRAVLSTGYGRDGAAQEILDEGMRGFAQKPYRIKQFSEVVAGALKSDEVSEPTNGHSEN